MSLPPPRQPDHEIDPIFIERHSPRAFTGEALPEPELMRMIEAARWAPSSYNSQPWRFLYALRGDANWETFLGLLVPANQKWAAQTGAILFLVSNGRMKVGDELKPSYSHSFDAGTASMAFQLQAIRQGWHAHGMVGFDHVRAPEVLAVPEHHRIEAAFAVGRKTAEADLSEEQKPREAPNGRRPIAEFAFPGGFPPAAA